MRYLAVLIAVITVFSLTLPAAAEEARRSATVVAVRGDVMVKNPGDSGWAAAKVGDVLGEGSFIKTGTGAGVTLMVDRNDPAATIDMSEKSLLSFETLFLDSITGSKKTLLDLAIGQILIKAEKLQTKDSKFEVRTPTSVVGVRGTKFSVKVDAFK